MNWILPGTVLEVDGSRPEAADELFSSLFVTGGLVLSQVCQITGLEPYAVQNWVKRGFLAPPHHHHQHAENRPSHGIHLPDSVLRQRPIGR